MKWYRRHRGSWWNRGRSRSRSRSRWRSRGGRGRVGRDRNVAVHDGMRAEDEERVLGGQRMGRGLRGLNEVFG